MVDGDSRTKRRLPREPEPAHDFSDNRNSFPEDVCLIILCPDSRRLDPQTMRSQAPGLGA